MLAGGVVVDAAERADSVRRKGGFFTPISLRPACLGVMPLLSALQPAHQSLPHVPALLQQVVSDCAAHNKETLLHRLCASCGKWIAVVFDCVLSFSVLR